jgi:hypothetical protein
MCACVCVWPGMHSQRTLLGPLCILSLSVTAFTARLRDRLREHSGQPGTHCGALWRALMRTVHEGGILLHTAACSLDWLCESAWDIPAI